MTDAELRELDAWIAEKFMGWSHIPNSNPLSWVDYAGKITTWETTGYGDAFQPTRLPAAFALAKREIERRGWEWQCASEGNPRHFRFTIWQMQHSRVSYLSDKQAETEELAGCLAVKAVIEGLE